VTLAALLATALLVSHPAAVPNLVRWHTHLRDAAELVRGGRLHVAVDGSFVISPLCETSVRLQTTAPGL